MRLGYGLQADKGLSTAAHDKHILGLKSMQDFPCYNDSSILVAKGHGTNS